MKEERMRLPKVTLDDMFLSQEERDNKNREYVKIIPIREITNFPNHPYKVREDDEMFSMVQTIKEYGVIHPILVRPKKDGGYEMISGHRRKRACQIAKITAKQTVRTIKLGIKATITAIKGIILATKALIAFLVAGGWIAVIVIVIICLIAMLCSSVFGIFFSSEDTDSTITINGTQQVVTMNQMISNLNMEFTNKITEIQKNNAHDEYSINSNRAEWKDILSVYAVEVSGGEEQTDVITLDDTKISKLKEIFWEMNTITYRTETVEKEIETTDDKGNIKKEKVKSMILYIDISSKSVEEMIELYKFNENQKIQLAELQKDEYNSMWSCVVYGSSTGSTDIVQVALTQVGNVGGQPYWSWYGFNSRVEWCACFVSWCANECGYIESGVIPKFAGCESEGVAWFKTCGLWKDGGYIPKARRYNFF